MANALYRNIIIFYELENFIKFSFKNLSLQLLCVHFFNYEYVTMAFM